MVFALFVAMSVVGAVIFTQQFFSRNAIIIRSLRDQPKKNIADFYNKEIGKVVGELVYLSEPLISPLTGRHCAYYQICVEEHVGGENAHWNPIIRESAGVEFGIVDGSGYAVVEPMNGLVVLTIDSNTRSGAFDDATARESAYLEYHQRKAQGWVFNKTLRYTEGVLEHGEVVAVMGRGVKEFDPNNQGGVEQGYRDAPVSRLRMQAVAEKSPLRISDVPETAT